MLNVAGLELFPPLAVFLAFAAAGLMLNLIPGADMVLVATTATRHGAKAGVRAALGIGAGTLVHILASVAGLAALLASDPMLYRALRIVGAFYLIWLAFSLVRPARRAEEGAAATAGRPFVTGMLVNVTNPKVALFFVAFLPQFTTPGLAHPAAEMLCLGLWFDLVGTGVNCLVALLAGRTRQRVRAANWIAAVLKVAVAIVLAGLGLRLILER